MEPLLAYRSFGDGVPILIIHGWQMDSGYEIYDFEPVFTTLTGFRRIYIDLPGMGATPAGSVQSLDDIFARLTHFVDNVLGASRFLVIGASLGGYLARALANKYARQVDGLLLRVPLVHAGKRDRDPFQPIIADPVVMSAIPETQRAMLEPVLVQTPEYITHLQAKIDQAIAPALRAADHAVLERIRNDKTRYRLSPQHDAGKEKFLAPTLIITARQDESVGYRDAISLLEIYPRSTFAVLDRETHASPIDDRTVFEALVRNWLRRVLEWQGSRVS